MDIRLSYFILFGCFVLLVQSAAIIDNSVYSNDQEKINNSDELLTTIVHKCFTGDSMKCIKGRVLSFLDTINGLQTENARSLKSKNIDKLIFERMVRAINTHEFKVQLPQTFFENTIITYRADRGLDFQTGDEGRGDMKKKLLLPVLLLLKLKLKAILPIIMSVIGLKAMKALILSKIAIKLVLGFIIYNLVQKLGGMKMAMMPMMPPAEPMSSYGLPASTPASTYEPSSWEPSGGPYARVWDSSNSGSAHNLAYSSYYPSSSSSSSSTSGSSSSPTYSSSSYSS